MPARLSFFAIAIALWAPASSADVYKCTDAAGKVEYRSAPCAAGAATQKVDVRHAAPSADAESSRARVAKESAEFNARYDARQAAKRDADAADLAAALAAQQQAVPERVVQEPVYVPYATNTCGGPGQPKCKVEVEIKRAPKKK